MDNFRLLSQTQNEVYFFLSNSPKYCEAEIALKALEEKYHINANNRRFDKKKKKIALSKCTMAAFSKWAVWGFTAIVIQYTSENKDYEVSLLEFFLNSGIFFLMLSM